MTYRLIRRFPTMAGRCVHLAVAPDGREVVVKRALDPAAAASLAGSVRQLRRLREMPEIAGYYPPVLDYTGDTVVLPYYRRGTLDGAAAGPRETFRRLVAEAVGCLFAVSAQRTFPAGSAGSAGSVGSAELSGPVLAARAFWRGQLTRRLDRLARAGADRWAEPFSSIAAALDDGLLDRLLAQAVRRPLGLAAHGDFGLHNVLLAGPDDAASDGADSNTADPTNAAPTNAAPTNADPTNAAPDTAGPAFRFIDLRGQTRWAGSLPWWDPVLDLATLITFHTLIEPALGVRDGIDRRPDPGSAALATLTRDELVAAAAAQPAVRSWVATDPTWQLRTQLGVVTRLLGSVSDQLLTAPGDRRARAGVLTDLLTLEWKALLSC